MEHKLWKIKFLNKKTRKNNNFTLFCIYFYSVAGQKFSFKEVFFIQVTPLFQGVSCDLQTNL